MECIGEVEEEEKAEAEAEDDDEEEAHILSRVSFHTLRSKITTQINLADFVAARWILVCY